MLYMSQHIVGACMLPSTSKGFCCLHCVSINFQCVDILWMCGFVWVWNLVCLAKRGARVEVVLRWVHTCNVTAYRNAVTLQETDTKRSYELNFQPVPHGVTVSCERYTLAFPVCYGSSGRWWRVTLPVHTCSGRNRTIPLMRRPKTDSTPNKPKRHRVTNFWYVTWSQVPSILSRYGVTLRGNVTSVCLPLRAGTDEEMWTKAERGMWSEEEVWWWALKFVPFIIFY